MLTPDQIQAIAKSRGDTVVDAPAVNRADELKTAWQTADAQQSHPVIDFLKGIVSAPATMIARPLQAAQSFGQLLGSDSAGLQKVSDQKLQLEQQLAKKIQESKAKGVDTGHMEQILKMSQQGTNYASDEQNTENSFQPKSGGLVAPAPKDFADVKKDVGRAVQTIALGLGPITGGATFGFGNSLEQGNDIFSAQTAMETLLGIALGKGLDIVGKPILNVAGKAISKVTPELLQDFAKGGVQAIKDFATKHNVLPETVSKAINETVQGVEETLNKPFEDTKKVVSKITDKTKTFFGGKTQEQILSTPETNLHKLNPDERKFYFDNQQTQINEKSSQLEARVKADLEQSTAKLQTEAESLNRDLSVASRDEVLAMRPKIREALGRQSQEYRRLVQEELAPHADVSVSQSDLSSFIENKYPDNPELAKAVKNKLGLSDETAIQQPTKKGELPTIQKGSDTTIGELYSKTQSLGQEIGTATKKGSRVYTADEKLTDDSISALTDFMKSKGVDLKNARQFWAKYAPVRNQLVTESKPFLQAPTQTKTFANTLTRVAKGTDVNNENFINEVENLIGEPLAKETKSVVAKLANNEKKALATKLDAEIKQAEIKLQKEQATKKLTDKAFEVERKARFRTAIKATIKTLLISGLGVEGVRKVLTGSF